MKRSPGIENRGSPGAGPVVRRAGQCASRRPPIRRPVAPPRVVFRQWQPSDACVRALVSHVVGRSCVVARRCEGFIRGGAAMGSKVRIGAQASAGIAQTAPNPKPGPWPHDPTMDPTGVSGWSSKRCPLNARQRPFAPCRVRTWLPPGQARRGTGQGWRQSGQIGRASCRERV